jgi:hypothetical protein
VPNLHPFPMARACCNECTNTASSS